MWLYYSLDFCLGFLKFFFIIFINYSLKCLCLYYSEREFLVKLSCSCLVLLHGFHYNFCFTIHHFYQSELYFFYYFSLWRFWVLFVKFHTSFLSICLLMAGFVSHLLLGLSYALNFYINLNKMACFLLVSLPSVSCFWVLTFTCHTT